MRTFAWMVFSRFFGFAAVACLVAPLVFALWISFSPDSFLTPPDKEWSLRWYRAFAVDQRWKMGLFRSLIVGGATAILGLIVAVPFAFAIQRNRFLGRGFLGGLVLVPMCVPPAVLGMGLLPLFYSVGLWGSLLGLVLVHCLICLPVIYLISRSHFARTNPDLEAAARGLGARPGQVAVRITIPLMTSVLVVGASTAFAISLNESLLTLFLATPTTETLPAIVWPELRYSPSPLVAVASFVSVLVALCVAVGFSLIVRFGGSRKKPISDQEFSKMR